MASDKTWAVIRGFRRGVIAAWLVAGVPAAMILMLLGAWASASICAIGFLLAVGATQREVDHA